MRGHTTAAGEVEVDDDGAFVDIDTPEDYEKMLSAYESGARGVGRKNEQR